MKNRKWVILLAGVTLLCGCSESNAGSRSASEKPQSVSDSAPAESSSQKSAPTGSEPDFMGYLVSGGTNYIGMPIDAFFQELGDSFTKENCIQQESVDAGSQYYQYSLGSMNSMLAGNIKLDQQYDIICSLKCKDDVIKCAKETITGITKDEAKKICDDFLTAFDGKLPDGYKQFTPLKHGKKYEVGFSKGTDDYVISMTCDETLEGDYEVFFALQIYAERYGMK